MQARAELDRMGVFLPHQVSESTVGKLLLPRALPPALPCPFLGSPKLATSDGQSLSPRVVPVPSLYPEVALVRVSFDLHVAKAVSTVGSGGNQCCPPEAPFL